MIGPTRLDPDLYARWRNEGWWTGETLSGLLADQAARRPEACALVDGEVRLTFADWARHVASASAWLRSAGVTRGDVVSIMLPNWWESLVLQMAVARIGAVINPLHLFYRVAELTYVLRQTQPRVVVHPGLFRKTDHAALVGQVVADVVPGATVLQVRGEGDGFAAVLDHPDERGDDDADSGDIALLLYTSGTTAAAKGVLHSHDTLVRAGRDLQDLFDIDGSDVLFMPSPVTHVAGLLYCLVVGPLTGASTVLLDVWDPGAALDLVIRHGCTFTGGATPFFQGLLEQARERGLGPADVPLTRGSCGGAGVPPRLVHDADTILGAAISRIYGLSEGITVTGSRSDAGPTSRAETDGPVLPGFRVRVADSTDHPVTDGTDGELQMRGPASCLGYLDPDHNAAAYTADGLFRTGDIVQVRDGAVRVTGRIKDIIIRAGENISARELEDLLSGHPLVADVAVVGVTDPVVGERACACVVTRSGADVSLQDLVAFLRAEQIATQKLPERIEILPLLPRTSSGKVQKHLLRAQLEHVPTLTSGVESP